MQMMAGALSDGGGSRCPKSSACGTFGGMPTGDASGQDQDCLLQGRKTQRLISEHTIGIPRILLQAKGCNEPEAQMFTGFGPQVSASSSQSHAAENQGASHTPTHSYTAGGYSPRDQSNPTRLVELLWALLAIRYAFGVEVCQRYADSVGMRKYKRYNGRKIQAGQMIGPLPTSGANCSYTGIKVLSARLPDGSGVS